MRKRSMRDSKVYKQPGKRTAASASSISRSPEEVHPSCRVVAGSSGNRHVQ